MDIKTLQYEAWANSERHGFHEDDHKIPKELVMYVIGTKLMLAVCELAESLEEVRAKQPLLYYGPEGKPEGIAAELADAAIRIGDLAEIVSRIYADEGGLDLEEAIKIKMAYNVTRPYKHGKTV